MPYTDTADSWCIGADAALWTEVAATLAVSVQFLITYFSISALLLVTVNWFIGMHVYDVYIILSIVISYYCITVCFGWSSYVKYCDEYVCMSVCVLM